MSAGRDMKRILRSGGLAFWRNKLVSASSLLVMTMTLLVLGCLILLNALLQFSLIHLQDRVDVNVYFYPNVSEATVLGLRDKLLTLPEINRVVYVSQDEAIAKFQERHSDDFLTLQAVQELDQNPLGASLNISASDSSRYAQIAGLFEGDSAFLQNTSEIIEKVNYNENKPLIDRLNQIIETISRIGIAVSLFFVIISILVTFNMIRLAIYTARSEISVMRLVGAGGRYVRGPFVVTGALYGIVSAFFALVLLYPISLWVSQKTETFFGGLDLVHYYLGNIIQFFIILFAAGMIIGMISSVLAMHKYLKK